MDTENPGEIPAADPGQLKAEPEDLRGLLAQRLAEALQENKALRDRLAELDISMNIETVELKKEIESLSRERDEATRENEFLLEDYTAKDHKIQELLRQIEIKQLMISETSSYLSTATDRIKNLEKQCSSLEAQYAGIYGNRTASEKIEEEADEAEPRNPLLEDIRKEFEETLGQKDLEIETLQRNMEQLKEENKSLAAEQVETEKDRAGDPRTPGQLENTLQEMEHSLLGLEQRISRASEIGVTEKEEILVKLDDAQREIFSLREYHRSLLEALRATDEEARQGVFSLSDYHQSLLEALRTKEQEHDILKTETAALIVSLQEQEALISSLREELEQSGRTTPEAVPPAEQPDHTEQRIRYLESALTQESTARIDLEDTLQRKDMILQELHEHFIADTATLQTETAAAQEAAAQAEAEARRLEVLAADRKEKITALTEQLAWQQEFGEARSREAAELAEKQGRAEELHHQALEAAAEEKVALQRLLQLRSEEAENLLRRQQELEAEVTSISSMLAQTQNLPDLEQETARHQEEIARLREENGLLSDRLAGAEKLQLETAAAREAVMQAEGEIRRLEALTADREKTITALDEQLTRQQGLSEAKSREAAELAEKQYRTEELHQQTLEAAAEEKAALQRLLQLRSEETENLLHRQQELEADVTNISAMLVHAQNLPNLEEVDRLRKENELLADRLAETHQKTETLEEIRIAVSLEIKTLAEKIDSLQDAGTADRATLRDTIDRSFAMITESTERLEQVIAEGLPLAGKAEGVPSGMQREDLPAVYTTVQPEPEMSSGPARSRRLLALLGLLGLLVLVTGIVLRQDLYRIWTGRENAATQPAAWETGTKQTTSGRYEVTLTFLNKEAVQVLGFSDVIPEAGLAHNTYALLEVKTSGGCIPEDFIASPERNLSFAGLQGTAVALRDPGALSGWKKAIYKQNACGKQRSGAIYMKHIISAEKRAPIKGLTVKGLTSEPITLK